MSYRASFALVLALPLLSVGCKDVVTYEPNLDHCTYNGGDQYCVEKFPDKPLCNADEGMCGIGDRYGCVAMVSPECHAPCGEPGDQSCVEGGGSSSSGTGESSDSGGTSDGSESGTTGPECMGDGDCVDAGAPFCDPSGACVSCEQMGNPDGACAEQDTALPVCDAGTCVQCTADNAAACGGTTPVCDENSECAPCVEHDQCPQSACHLDGELRGACFDLAEVQMITDTGELTAALGDLGAMERVVFVLTSGDYGITIGLPDSVEVAFISSGGTEFSGSGAFDSVTVSSNAIAYFGGITIAGNSNAGGVSCSGTSVWLDDSEVRNNAQAGMDVSGGCAAHLRRSVVRTNSSGGIIASDSPVYLVNSAVGENLDAGTLPGIQLTNGELWMSYSSVVANLAVGGTIDSIQCFGTPSGEVRNSVVLATSGSSIAADCDGISWSNNALDTADLDTVNGMAMSYDAGWFDPAEGDYHLTTAGSTELEGLASWQDGDPVTDIDGDPIPTDMPSYPGYDQP